MKTRHNKLDADWTYQMIKVSQTRENIDDRKDAEKRTNERTNEPTNEQTSEQTNERAIERNEQKFTSEILRNS